MDPSLNRLGAKMDFLLRTEEASSLSSSAAGVSGRPAL
jgi:hypothetical protein